jgi:hypothetical protein
LHGHTGPHVSLLYLAIAGRGYAGECLALKARLVVGLVMTDDEPRPGLELEAVRLRSMASPRFMRQARLERLERLSL